MRTITDYLQFFLFLILFIPFILLPMVAACGVIKLCCYMMGEGWIKVYISDGKYEDVYDRIM